MSKSRRIFTAVFALAVALVASPGRADDATELERAKTSYDAGRYAEGVDRFREILNSESAAALRDPAAIEKARAYYAACLIALGRSDEADVEIEKLIRNNPLYSPDPVAFPGKVVDRFIDAKARLKGEIEEAYRARAEIERAARAKVEREQRAYIDSLRRLASEESIVVRNSRWMALVPFGAGQFQNRQDGLGAAFLISEAVLSAVSITTGIIHMQLASEYPSQEGRVEYTDFEFQLKTSRQINHYSTAALGVIAFAGIVHAQVTFVPEFREIRVRPLPKAPVITPTVSPSRSGFVLGLSGRF